MVTKAVLQYLRLLLKQVPAKELAGVSLIHIPISLNVQRPSQRWVAALAYLALWHTVEIQPLSLSRAAHMSV